MNPENSSSERLKPGRKPTAEITDAQTRTLKAIRKFVDQRGFPPTSAELGEMLNITNASAHDQISQLVRKGYLKREPGKARGLTIVREPASPMLGLVSVPIIGRVAAGLPILADENVVGEVLVESSVVSGGRFFALEVQGDSMKGGGINEGDTLIVRQQPVSESGDIVVALLEDEATVKRLYIRDDQIELRPENPRYKPIPIGADDDLRIVGKVVAVRGSGDKMNG